MYLYLFIIVFFFQSSGAHRDLHSFPTRRSSDLGEVAGWLARRRQGDLGRQPGLYLFERMILECDQVLKKVRSEEHTSELQSQFHLVCRLLLEKKKKKIIEEYKQFTYCQGTPYIF